MLASVAFDDVAQVLAAGGSTVHAAEAHGCLCGSVCARRTYSLGEWLDEILPGAEPGLADEAGGGPLATLHEETVCALAAPDMEFEPLLPDDERDLPTRVEALGVWCQGFLYGFGAAGTVAHAALPEAVTEVLSDLANISHAGAVGSASDEVEEDAYVELVEFLRAGVQLVHDELAALRLGQPRSRTNH